MFALEYYIQWNAFGVCVLEWTNAEYTKWNVMLLLFCDKISHFNDWQKWTLQISVALKYLWRVYSNDLCYLTRDILMINANKIAQNKQNHISTANYSEPLPFNCFLSHSFQEEKAFKLNFVCKTSHFDFSGDQNLFFSLFHTLFGKVKWQQHQKMKYEKNNQQTEIHKKWTTWTLDQNKLLFFCQRMRAPIFWHFAHLCD